MNDNIEELETIEEKEIVKYLELEESLLRLEKNPDFKKVFMDFYMGEWAKERIGLLATAISQDRVKVMELLVGVANFENFMLFIKNMASSARSEAKQK